MKNTLSLRFRLLLFIFHLSLFTFSNALPFQEPVAGNYSCFSSQESIFDENAQATGATLTFNADGSYTFATSSASENGSVAVSEDTSTELNDYFQSGSSLVLQSSEGTSINGMFVTDKQGGMYAIIQNSNGTYIRCDSPGADIASAILQIGTEQAATEQTNTGQSDAGQTNTEQTQTNQETQNATTPETISVPDIGELVVGGQIEAGDYNCISNYDYRPDWNDMDKTSEFVLSLYPDMGLRIIQGDNTELTNVFSYNQDTGELSADPYKYSDIFNDAYDNIVNNYFYDSSYGDTIYTFKFYRDTQNQPILYGETIEDSTEEDIVTTACRYAGASQRTSPVAEDVAQVEAEKFKYVTAPGQGVQLPDIEGIIHTGENVWTVTGLQFQEGTYLLLKDGTVYKNLQVPPADLNVTDSKQYEQENWGQWQRNGDSVSVQWFGSSELVLLDGFFVLPAQTDERLDASYEYFTGSTLGMVEMGGVVSTSSDTIIFMPDGRFEKSSYNTMGSTNTVGLGPDQSMSSGYYSDEEGSVGGTTFSGTDSGVSVTTKSTNPNPPATTGTYMLDGYTLELRFDDGRIERMFFYFWDDKKDNAVIGGLTYSLE